MLSHRSPPIFDCFKAWAAAPGPKPRAAVENRAEMLKHIAVLHPHCSGGTFTLASKVGGVYSETNHRPADALAWFELANRQFVSMNRFMRRKTGNALAAVGHAWLDFDPYAEDARGNALPYRGMAPEALMAILAAAIAEAGLPAPSYWTSSGRGLHAVWVCESLSGKAAPKLARIMEALYGPTLNEDGSVPARKHADPDRDAQEARLAPMWRAFRDAGLDMQTQDSARVLRLWGSVNPESGLLCKRLWPEFVEDVQRCRVDLLADAVLPLTNEAYRARMAEKATLSQIEDSAPAKPRKAAWSYSPKAGAWERKAADLLRLREHLGGIAKGRRHLWAFLTANALAHAKGGTVSDWANLVAPLAGLSVGDVRSSLASLGRRHDRHLQGETRDHGGIAWSPLYHHRGITLAKLMGITDELADEAGLFSVRPSGTVALTSTQRSAQKRIKDGAVPQDAQAEAGRQGRAMLAEGRSKAETIATLRALFDKGATWCKEAMRDVVDAAPVETVVEVAPSVSEDVEKVGRFSGRYIGGSCPGPADRTETEAARVVPEPVAKVPTPVLYDKPIVIRRCATSYEYRTGPETTFWVIWSEFHRSWSAVSFDAATVEMPEGFLAERRKERLDRLEAYRTGARRSTGRVPKARRMVAVDHARAAEEYRRASQGF